MKKNLDSFYLNYMGWIKPKNHLTLLSPYCPASRTITDQTKRLISSSWQFPYEPPTAVQLGPRVKSRRVKRIGLG